MAKNSAQAGFVELEEQSSYCKLLEKSRLDLTIWLVGVLSLSTSKQENNDCIFPVQEALLS